MEQERQIQMTRKEFLVGMGGLVGGVIIGKLIPEIGQGEMRKEARRELEDLHNSITTDYGFHIKMAKANEDSSVAGIHQTYVTGIGPLQLGLNKDGTRTMGFRIIEEWRDYVIEPTGVFQTGKISAFPSGKKFPYRLSAETIRELSALLRNIFRSGNPPKNPELHHVSLHPIRLQ